jgi:predicted peptidase
LGILISFVFIPSTFAQSPAEKPEPKKQALPAYIEPDPRVKQCSYHFDETDEEMSYVLYVSSKVSKEKKNPLIVALHGYGGDGNFLVRERLVDFAEEHGYIVVGPLGYNVTGWYGIPKALLQLLRLPPVDPPPNLAELSKKDVMNVLNIMRKEFNIDENRIYLMGHSMGGSGALFLGQKYTDKWAAIACIAPVTYMMMDQKQFLANIRDARIPVMIIQGDRDSAVEIKYTRQWVSIMKELKMEHEYIELPGGDHGTVKNDGMPDMFRFFAEHKKGG